MNLTIQEINEETGKNYTNINDHGIFEDAKRLGATSVENVCVDCDHHYLECTCGLEQRYSASAEASFETLNTVQEW